MTNVICSHPRHFSLQTYESAFRNRSNRVLQPGNTSLHFLPGELSFGDNQNRVISLFQPGRSVSISQIVCSKGSKTGGHVGDFGDEHQEGETGEVNSDTFREGLERIVGKDDSTFSGVDLATLIRNKYGRSYDVQLIKKEFLGRNLLALNVMWKYREQRSFPLTEEEYLLRLDDVANTLKCWGAVSHIRNSLAKLKERPRIGKAVSIFIDMDETGGRSNEWIYK